VDGDVDGGRGVSAVAAATMVDMNICVEEAGGSGTMLSQLAKLPLTNQPRGKELHVAFNFNKDFLKVSPCVPM
jgi:hypothetical protein